MPNILIASSQQLRLDSVTDIRALLETAYGADGVLLLEGDLSSAFFDLRSGIAGELFQKCTNYRLRLALVVPDPAAHGERISELAREHAKHKLIRFFALESDALEWLETP